MLVYFNCILLSLFCNNLSNFWWWWYVLPLKTRWLFPFSYPLVI